MLKMFNLKKKFYSELGEVKIVFDDLSFEAKPGDFITVIGSNGAGKSTFLNTLSGEVELDSGEIILDGINIEGLKAHKRANIISKVHQNVSSGTAPSMTVLENMSIAYNKGKKFGLGFGLEISKIEEFKESLKTLGLGIENQLETNVGLLSGGQRQCLSLLMSTFNKPKLLLLDEHTAALDPETAKIILEKTNEIVYSNKELITFMITHNMEDAIKYGNRLIMLHKGNIIFDIRGEEKNNLTVEKLLEMFKNKEIVPSDNDIF